MWPQALIGFVLGDFDHGHVLGLAENRQHHEVTRRASGVSFHAIRTLRKSSQSQASGTTKRGRPACMRSSLVFACMNGSAMASRPSSPTTMMSAARACLAINLLGKSSAQRHSTADARDCIKYAKLGLDLGNAVSDRGPSQINDRLSLLTRCEIKRRTELTRGYSDRMRFEPLDQLPGNLKAGIVRPVQRQDRPSPSYMSFFLPKPMDCLIL